MDATLHVKIGPYEFNAEGTEELVSVQFERFLAAVGSKGTLPPVEEKPSETSPKKNNAVSLAGLDEAVLDAAFMVDDKSIVSLKALPKTPNRDADALVLILYGYRAVQKIKDMVPVLDVAASARQSGIQFGRIDRAIAANMKMVNKGGHKRGSRYSLNNAGILHAESLLREMFG